MAKVVLYLSYLNKLTIYIFVKIDEEVCEFIRNVMTSV